ncbi:unnamed protein product, partial [Mesorhabditis spiculigera]
MGDSGNPATEKSDDEVMVDTPSISALPSTSTLARTAVTYDALSPMNRTSRCPTACSPSARTGETVDTFTSFASTSASPSLEVQNIVAQPEMVIAGIDPSGFIRVRVRVQLLEVPNGQKKLNARITGRLPRHLTLSDVRVLPVHRASSDK